ncbi:MAG: NmrA family NAD(P)-binding protein [Myxococcales bacterium]|nr:NmrA family NAD(P)-binding protein [Myxococcales bacterium]
MKFAVAGVTGHTGKVVAESLLAGNHEVRVIVRDIAKGEPFANLGCDVAVADLGDAPALSQALTGMDGAYLLVPPRIAPGFRDYQLATGRSLVSAARTSGIPHVVFLSSIAAHIPAGTGPIAGLYPIEQGFRALVAENRAFSATFLRAGYFMENLGASLGALSQGILPCFVPVDLPIAMIATHDIGQFAAKLLVEGGRGARAVQLGGPACTMADAAAALTEILGRTIVAVQAPIDQLVSTFTSFGFPAEVASLYQEMTVGLTNGLVVFEPNVETVEGKMRLADVLPLLLRNG